LKVADFLIHNTGKLNIVELKKQESHDEIPGYLDKI
jgi:hypothetical protein